MEMSSHVRSRPPLEATLEDNGSRSGLPKAGSFRELLAVAVPLVLSSGSISLMIAIDRLFLTWYSEDALAASTPAAALHWTVIGAFVGTINYANAFVAQYEGAGRKDRVMASVWQAIFLAVIAGSCFGPGAVFLRRLQPGRARAGSAPAGDAVLPARFASAPFPCC